VIKHEKARSSLIMLRRDIFEPNYEKERRMYEKFKVVFGYISQQEKKEELFRLYRKLYRDSDELTIKEYNDLINVIRKLEEEIEVIELKLKVNDVVIVGTGNRLRVVTKVSDESPEVLTDNIMWFDLKDIRQAFRYNDDKQIMEEVK